MKMINNSKPTSSFVSWAFWFFPVIALGITGWILYSHIKKQGPTITVEFEDAAGLQAEKTSVRFRGVEIGLVKEVVISEDTKNVVATINLQKEAERFAVEGSKFWLVTPQVSFQGVKGLDTLIEGSYIAASPGKEEATESYDFKGTNNTEGDALENTTAYFLETSNVESINPGDAVTFRGLQVGNVTRVTLGKTAQVVVVQINLQNRYTRLIRNNTSFWRKAGIQASLGLFGSKVKINSLDSILRGGVEIFTPDPAGPRAKAGSRYNLSADAPKGYEKWNPVLE
jgi:paraquat-inducible protein B